MASAAVLYVTLFISALLILKINAAPSQQFRCMSTENCSCTISPQSDYELNCPDTLTPRLTINFQPDKYIQFQCTNQAKPEDYDMLTNFFINDIDFFKFYTCPLRNDFSFRDIFNRLGVNKVRTLLYQNLGSNFSYSIKREHLKGLKDVSRLGLSGIGLTDLPANFLEDMRDLIWLDLRANNVRLPTGFFDWTPKLEALELGHNGITHLEPGIFKNLTNLKRLLLWQNSLKNLQADVFIDLINLEVLDLSSNGLEELPADIFGHLKKLKSLNLYANYLTELPEGLLRNNSLLESFLLYDNRATLRSLPNDLLSNFSKLEEVRMSRCNISNIPEGIFWGSKQIKNITLAYNLLSVLPIELFRDTTGLLDLDLGNNRFTNIPDQLFIKLEKLQSLKINDNLLTVINEGTFSGLKTLKYLNLENNKINFINGAAFKPATNIREIYLSNNNLSFINNWTDIGLGPPSPFNPLVNLEKLYLANNSISEVSADWRIVLFRLKYLDLSWNNFHYLHFSDSFHFLSYDITVDFRNNNVSEIDMAMAESVFSSDEEIHSDAMNPPTNYARFLLEGNPVICSCRAYYLLQYFEGKLDPRVRAKVELVPGKLTCAGPPQYAGVPLTSVSSKEVTCEIGSGSNKDRCPEGCRCFVRFYDESMIVNCSNLQLAEAPKRLPMQVKFPHIHLHLENNNLKSLPQTSFGYENVKSLYISHNNISVIDWLPHKLEVLEIDHNNLTHINKSVLQCITNSTSLRRVTLHGNPWDCDCDAVNLVEFIQNTYRKIINLTNITCQANKRQMSLLTINDLCPFNTRLIIGLSIAASLFFLLIGICAALYYRYQQEIKVWMFAHRLCLCLVTEEELDRNKEYDAFISYSHKDQDFVINELVPNLEKGDNPFKLCIDVRDWIAGEYIPSEIARSVKDSRRTLVVLSPNFLESVWGKMEFRSSHLNALKEGRVRVIVIKYGDIGPLDNLDPELRAYLTMNIYIEWGDKHFWDKLRYALPHPAEFTKKGRWMSLKFKERLDDRLELIRPVSTPPAVTTPPAESADTNPLVEKMNGIANHNGFINGGLITNEVPNVMIPNGGLKSVQRNGGLNASIISNGNVLNGKIVNTAAKQSDV